ncbi:SHOCT domain-containing protein [Lysinimonas soli]|uniref:SHOCT domain-containing protein n=1 Tax=Lysinimonas soli TaxID=1074233 RepID=A0ABW0NN06_9MICO
MLTSTALAAAVPFAHPALGFGFGLLFILGHLFWLLVIVAVIIAVTRRRRHWAAAGFGPWGHGPWGHGAFSDSASRAAETTLAERFAQGDIDEKEYRARLEVLRANAPQPPMGPVGPQK